MTATQRAGRQAQRANSFDTRSAPPLKFTPAQQESIIRQIDGNAEFADALPTVDTCLRAPIDLLDLNGDGHPDPVFMGCMGAHNEEIFFFLWARGSYRLVLADWVGYFGYEMQDTRTHGLPLLRLITHGSCCQHGNAYYAFDGRQYRAVACYEEHHLNEDFSVFEDRGRPSDGRCTF